jgi:hypothetical protein
MRMQLYIPEALVTVLHDLAWRENRAPKQQAEWLLWQALEQVAAPPSVGPDASAPRESLAQAVVQAADATV